MFSSPVVTLESLGLSVLDTPEFAGLITDYLSPPSGTLEINNGTPGTLRPLHTSYTGRDNATKVTYDAASMSMHVGDAVAAAAYLGSSGFRVRSVGSYGFSSNNFPQSTAVDAQIKRAGVGHIGVYAADGTTVGTLTVGKFIAGGGAFCVDLATAQTRVYNNGSYGFTAAGTADTTADAQLRRVGAANIGVYAADGTTLGTLNAAEGMFLTRITGPSTSSRVYEIGANGVGLGANAKLSWAPATSYGSAGDLFNVKDAFIGRYATGPAVQVQAAGGLRVMDLAGTAEAPALASAYYLNTSGSPRGLMYFSAAQNRLYAQAAYPWVVEADLGLKVRNSANTADGPITCGAINASGDVAAGSLFNVTTPNTTGATCAYQLGGNSNGIGAFSTTHVYIKANNIIPWAMLSTGPIVSFGKGYGFTSSPSIAGPLGVAMEMAIDGGGVEINTGTQGVYRDLRARDSHLSESIGLWGVTPPAVQPSAIADATDPASTMAAVNSVLAALRSYGFIAT